MLYESPNFRLETDELVATLWLNLQGRPEHTLTLPLINELTLLADRVAQMKFLDALVIRSGRPETFCLGLETETWRGLKTPNEIAAAVMRGQELARKIADLPMPVFAFVEGACEAGGLELAMACSAVIAVNRPSVRFRPGFADQGLVPCWGGTFRLTSRMGNAHARTWLRTNLPMNAETAVRTGVADLLVPEFAAETSLRRALDRVTDGGTFSKSFPQRVRGWVRRQLPSGRMKANDSVISTFTDQLVGLSRHTLVENHIAERRAIAQLLGNPVIPTRLPVTGLAAMDSAISTTFSAIPGIAWLGAGCAASGFAKDLRARGVEIREISSEPDWHRDPEGDRVGLWSELLLVPGEDPEEIRRQLAVIAGRTAPGTVIALLGNSVSVGEIQAGLPNPAGLVGLHRPDWSVTNDLVEVSAGPRTSPEALNRLESWLCSLGFSPERIIDRIGHVSDALLLAFLSEAVALVSDGFSAKEIDQLATRLGFARPPLEWCDEIGFEPLATLTAQIQLARRDNFARPLLFQKFQANGWKGKSNGEGFYRYRWWKSENELARMLLWRDHDRQTRAPYIADMTGGMTDAGDRLIHRVLNEAARLASHDTVSLNKTADRVATLAVGWPKSLAGPMQLMDDTGLLRIVNRLHELRVRYGERFRPCAELLRRTEAGLRFTQTVGVPTTPQVVFQRQAG